MPINKDELVKMVDEVPAFPASVHKILDITSNTDCSPKELVAIIEHDPILTIKVLKLVNSAYFGLSREVTSVNHAVVYVGINTIKNVAISVATAGVLPDKNKAGLDMDAFWLHSLSVGVIGRLLAKKHAVPQTQQANYFVAGLLHDIGKVLFAHFKPNDYKPVLDTKARVPAPLFKIERKMLDVTHSQLGGMLAEKWQLPPDLIKAIRNHHRIGKISDPCDIEIAISAANKISHYVEEKQHDIEAQVPKISEVESEWLGQSIEDVIHSLDNLEEEIDRAKAFINI